MDAPISRVYSGRWYTTSMSGRLPLQSAPADFDQDRLLRQLRQDRAVDRVISRQLSYLRGKPGAKPLDVRLEAAGCPRFAECVRQHVKKLAQSESTHGIADSLLLAEASA